MPALTPSLTLAPIGHLETPWATPGDCPRNGRQPVPRPLCRAVVAPEFRAGLDQLDSFSHLILLYWMHLGGPAPLVVTPRFAAGPRGDLDRHLPHVFDAVGVDPVRALACALPFAAVDRALARL